MSDEHGDEVDPFDGKGRECPECGELFTVVVTVPTSSGGLGRIYQTPEEGQLCGLCED